MTLDQKKEVQAIFRVMTRAILLCVYVIFMGVSIPHTETIEMYMCDLFLPRSIRKYWIGNYLRRRIYLQSPFIDVEDDQKVVSPLNLYLNCF